MTSDAHRHATGAGLPSPFEEISSGNPGDLPAGLLLPGGPSRQAPTDPCLFKAANRLKPERLPLPRPRVLHPEQTCMGVLVRSLMLAPHPFTCCESTSLVRTSRLIRLPRRGPAHLAACLALTGKMLRIQLLQPTKRYEHSLDRSIPESPPVRAFALNASGSRLGRLRLSPRAAASTVARLETRRTT